MICRQLKQLHHLIVHDDKQTDRTGDTSSNVDFTAQSDKVRPLYAQAVARPTWAVEKLTIQKPTWRTIEGKATASPGGEGGKDPGEYR
jgi:hypothetical protein